MTEEDQARETIAEWAAAFPKPSRELMIMLLMMHNRKGPVHHWQYAAYDVADGVEHAARIVDQIFRYCRLNPPE